MKRTKDVINDKSHLRCMVDGALPTLKRNPSNSPRDIAWEINMVEYGIPSGSFT